MDKIEWHTLEYTPRKNSSDWYWAVGIISVSIAVVSVFFGNIIFAILVLISAFSLAMFAARHPSTLSCEVNTTGIRIDKNFYPYDTLEAFWIEDHHQHPQALIKSKKVLMPLIVMPIAEVYPEEVRDFLVEYLKETELHEPITQKLMEHLGF